MQAGGAGIEDHRPLRAGVAAYVLAGPTAVGKSAVAHRLAARTHHAVLSADSMAVYRGMDTGTAKPGKCERKEVTYFGIDVVNPDQSFSTGDYVDYVRGAVSEEAGCEGLIIAGGTGLYIKALIEGLDPLPGANEALRRDAEDLLAREGLAALQAEVERRAAEHYRALRDRDNPRRLIRALEIAEGGGAVRDGGDVTPQKIVGLRMERELLCERIERRVRTMYSAGLLEEAEYLRDQFGDLSHTAAQAIGYREAFAVLDGAMRVEEAMERTAVRTRQLAKRQMTWFRGQANVAWVDVDAQTDVDAVAEQVMILWERYGRTATRI